MAKKVKEPKAPKVKKEKEPKVKKAKKEKKVKEKKIKEKKVKKVKEPKVKKASKQKRSKTAANAVEPRKYRVIGSPARVLAVAAAIGLVLGLFLFKFYSQYYSYVDYVVGGVIALMGLFSLAAYFVKNMIDGVYRNEFAMGLVCLGVGGYIILRSGNDYTFFLTVIGLLCALDAVIKLQYTLDLVRMGYKKWYLPLAFSLISLALSVVILMDLLGGLKWADKVIYTGLALCVNAVLDIATMILIALRNRKASKAAASLPEEVTVPAEPEIQVEIVPEEELIPAVMEEFPASIPGEAAQVIPVPVVEEEPVDEDPELLTVPEEMVCEEYAEEPTEEDEKTGE